MPWGWRWYIQKLTGEETISRCVTLAAINGSFGFLVGLYYFFLLWGFGIFVFTVALFSFIGIVFVKLEKYMAAAIFMMISGILFLPIGIIGIAGGMIAWHQTDRYLAKHRKARRGRIKKKGRKRSKKGGKKKGKKKKK